MPRRSGFERRVICPGRGVELRRPRLVASLLLME
jgi:hypothetical protein